MANPNIVNVTSILGGNLGFNLSNTLTATLLTVDAENATFAIGSATTTVTATMNGGAIPSIGLVIALGG